MYKYESLNQLVEIQGCTVLSNVRVAKNAKYTHSSIVHEFQECIVEIINGHIVKELNKSPFNGIIIDEAIYMQCKCVTRFLGNVELEMCDANGIVGCIKTPGMC